MADTSNRVDKANGRVEIIRNQTNEINMLSSLSVYILKLEKQSR